jgi:tetratricopeptide (TPR) repeat protein
LRAWYQLSLGTLDSLQRAQDAFKASLNQDGAHALSLAGMAESYAEIGLSGRTPPAQQNIYLLPGASEAALKALQLDPFLPEAHAVRGKTLTAYTFDFAGAEAHLHRALRGDEGPAATHLWLALTLVATGRIDEADEHLRKALEGDPRSPALHTVSGLVRYIAGDHAAAVKEATTALELEPTYWAASLVCGLAQAALAQYGPAEASLNAAVDRSDRHPLAVAALGCELALSGQRSSVVGLLKELDDAKRSRYVPALALAVLHLAMNQVDTALTDLSQSAEDQNWIAFLHRTPLFDAIRADERFTTLLRQVGVLGGESAAA